MLRDHASGHFAFAVLLGLVVAGLGVTGCTGASSPALVTTTPIVATTTASTAPTTTVYTPSAVQKTQDAAGGYLVAAWKAGDRAAALADATPAAVDAVFAQPYPAGGVQARGCSSAVAGPSFCVYRILANGSLLSLSAMAVPGGWIISAAQLES
jgi:hypothetical protein